MAAEAEHGQSDEGVGGFEAEGDAGDEPDLGVDRFGAAVGQAVLDRGQDRRGVRDDAFLQFHERRDPASAGPADPPVQRLAGLLDGHLEDQPETLFELVAAVQPGVCPGDPVEFDALFLGEVLRIFPQHVAHALQPAGTRTGRPGRGVGRRPARSTFRLGLPGQSAGVVPGLTAHLVQGVGGPPHHVERISTAHRVRAVLGHDLRDELGPVGGHMRDQGAPLRPQTIEKRLQGGHVTAGGGPHQAAAVVIDDHREVAVPTLITDLVDPEPAQTGEPVVQRLGVRPDPGDDRPHGPPRDPHQLRDGALGRLGGQPGHRVIEFQGMPRAVPRPRHVRHHHAVLAAGHPRRVGLQHRLHRAQVQRPPAAPALTGVIPGATAPAHPTTTGRTPGRPYPHDQHLVEFVELDVLDDRLLHTQ